MLKRASAVLTALVLVAALAAAQSPKPLTFDDFIKIRRVTDPQPSPDGKWIAFVVTVMDKEANRGNSDVWIVPTAGGEPRRLTTAPGTDNNPRWSPDGSTIAFISTRSGGPQIWMIRPEGGEAWPVTTLSTGASGLLWSPDGKSLAFTSSVYPEAKDDEANKKMAEAAERSKVKGRVYETLFFRYWNAWRDGTRNHVFVVPAAGGPAVDVTPGDFDAPPMDLGGHLDYAFSPDSREIAFVRNVDPELKKGIGTNNDVFVTPASGGPITPITTNKANDNQPSYSPDGKFLAYKAMARPGYESDKLDLMLYDRAAKKALNLTRSVDVSVDETLWAADGSAVYFNTDEKGRNALYRVSVPSGKIERIMGGRTFSGLSLLGDGRTFVVLEQAMNRPADVWAYDAAAPSWRRITDTNKTLLAGLAMNPAEEFWFTGGGND